MTASRRRESAIHLERRDYMINISVNRVLYKGDGTNTAFPISFPFLDKKDITVARVSKDNETTELKEDYFIDDTSRTVHFPGYTP